MIVESFVALHDELTVLTVSSSAGVCACEPIGQRQDHGDYRESWQPADINREISLTARDIAIRAVEGLVDGAHRQGETGWGVFGVELFVLDDGSVLFNEMSPRPHDTGMVTMASQRLSEFALHARAILGFPITQDHVRLDIRPDEVAASHAIVLEGQGEAVFTHAGRALSDPGTDLRIFGKPSVNGHRRMAVSLAIRSTAQEARSAAATVADRLHIDVS